MKDKGCRKCRKLHRGICRKCRLKGKTEKGSTVKKLKEIYKEIDNLEKSKIDVQEFRKKHESFLPLALLALALFSLEIILRYLVFRKFP